MSEQIILQSDDWLRASHRCHVGVTGVGCSEAVGHKALQLLFLVVHQNLRPIRIVGEVLKILLHLKKLLGVLTLRVLELHLQRLVNFAVQSILVGFLVILCVVFTRVITTDARHSKARSNTTTGARGPIIPYRVGLINTSGIVDSCLHL